jgi:hypothetical protein
MNTRPLPIGVGDHAAEFVEAEQFAILAHPQCPIEDRAGRGEFLAHAAQSASGDVKAQL